MTRLLLWLPLLVIGVAALLVPIAAQRLHPRSAALSLTAAAVVAAGCWAYCLALMAFTVVGQIPVVATYGRWSLSAVRSGDPAPQAVGAIATLVLIVTAAASTTGLWRRGRAVVRGEQLARRHRHLPLVVLQDHSPRAYSIGGLTGGTIAVSTGMLAALDGNERDCLLAHERAHVAGRHHLLRLLVGLAAIINPALRQFPDLVETATERWADEHAASVVGDRRTVAIALSKAALAGVTDRHPRTSPAHATGYDGASVPDRVRHLLKPLPSARPVELLTLWTLSLGALVTTALASRDVEKLFEHARAVEQATGHW